ncbi:MAG: DUF6273 domain-containing protein [Oscillospiraceae bacterium]|jgi:serine/threonine protein kinase|nr:DUF6273 domain-containing protein [Oscillospiraceae bacterium]
MILTGIFAVRYTLDPTPIGSGGEGDVYKIVGDNTIIAKIYRDSILSLELEEKLKIMIKHPPSESVLSQVAWPLDVVYDDNGRCCGFIMPKLNINSELGEIYKYPSMLPISVHQKIKIAQNICVVISEVHKAGYVFGDFNPRNIGLDINTGLVSFLDTDTYHVVDSVSGKTYRCNVCASGYAAPELLEKCSDYLIENPTASKAAYSETPLPTFTQETDNFALAIHVFKLLMNGYTPFGGIIETASVSQSSPGVGDSAVRRNSYCFRPGYKPQSVAIPGLETLPEEIQDLFTRAFIVGRHDPKARPSAFEWHKALLEFEQDLITCSDNPLHQYDKKNEICPLCEADKRFSNAMVVEHVPSIKQTTYNKPPETSQGGSSSSYAKRHGQIVQTPVTKPKHSQNQAQTKPTFTSTSSSNVSVSNSNNKIISRGERNTAIIIATLVVTLVVVSFILSNSSAISIGEIVSFGEHYWRVLDVQGSYALIMTEKVIEQRAYHHEMVDVTWETSTIRQYLNGDFLNSFSQTDRTRIRETTIANDNNQWFGTEAGNITTDRIFLLSIEEVVRYFGDSGHLSRGVGEDWGDINDHYNAVRVAPGPSDTGPWWWLRSPGFRSNSAARVISDGRLNMAGLNVNFSDCGVRPALWLNLES